MILATQAVICIVLEWASLVVPEDLDFKLCANQTEQHSALTAMCTAHSRSEPSHSQHSHSQHDHIHVDSTLTALTEHNALTFRRCASSALRHCCCHSATATSQKALSVGRVPCDWLGQLTTTTALVTSLCPSPSNTTSCPDR